MASTGSIVFILLNPGINHIIEAVVFGILKLSKEVLPGLLVRNDVNLEEKSESLYKKFEPYRVSYYICLYRIL